MSNTRQTRGNLSIFKRACIRMRFLASYDIPITISIVTFSFLVGIISLTYVDLTPGTRLGESIERVMPATYWASIAVMIIAISSMLGRRDTKRLKIPFLLSCMMLIFSMRSVLAVLSPYPPVNDTYGGIYVTLTWQKYGIFSPQGMSFFESGYVKAWPPSFLIAYFITSAGVPVFSFYMWAPTVIFILDLVVIYLLFKELANEKVGMVSAFLFTLLNTNSVFTLHYCPQAVGALFYLVAMYALVKAYKTRRVKHLALALLSIFAVVLTHHMTTFYLGISLAGIYLAKLILRMQKSERGKWFPLAVKSDTFIKFSPLLSVFTFVLWYFYGFIVYGKDATFMLAEIMRLLTTGQPRYAAGYYHYYLIQSPMSQLSVLMFPAFIVITATAFLSIRILKKKPLDGYLWLTIGWAVSLILTFIFGNIIYGNYIDPSRSRELITLALYPASAMFLLKVFESKSLYIKALATSILIIIAFFSVFSIYRGAENIVYYDLPWYITILPPPS